MLRVICQWEVWCQKEAELQEFKMKFQEKDLVNSSTLSCTFTFCHVWKEQQQENRLKERSCSFSLHDRKIRLGNSLAVSAPTNRSGFDPCHRAKIPQSSQCGPPPRPHPKKIEQLEYPLSPTFKSHTTTWLKEKQHTVKFSFRLTQEFGGLNPFNHLEAGGTFIQKSKGQSTHFPFFLRLFCWLLMTLSEISVVHSIFQNLLLWLQPDFLLPWLQKFRLSSTLLSYLLWLFSYLMIQIFLQANLQIPKTYFCFRNS